MATMFEWPVHLCRQASGFTWKVNGVLVGRMVLGINWGYTRPVISKPSPLNRDYNRDPNIKALKDRGFINHGSPLGPRP